LKPVVIKEDEETIKVLSDKPAEIIKNSLVTTLYLTLGAIFVRFFVVVDIMINFFGKINVELGPNINKLVVYLKQAEFPKIDFTARTSPLNDGGEEAIENHENFLEQKKKSTTKTSNIANQLEEGSALVLDPEQKSDLDHKAKVIFIFLHFLKINRVTLC
jgi:hypothetical protein